MTRANLFVGAYQVLDDALADWEELHAAIGVGDLMLIDAAVAEHEDRTVRTLHRFAHTAYGSGVIAGAVLGLLLPPSLVAGAVAGGVGEHVIRLFATTLDRADLKFLGEMIDRCPVAVVALSNDPVALIWSALLGRSSDTGTAQADATISDIARAVELDRVERQLEP